MSIKRPLPALQNTKKVNNPDFLDIADKNYAYTILKYGGLAVKFPQLKTNDKTIVGAINELDGGGDKGDHLNRVNPTGEGYLALNIPTGATPGPNSVSLGTNSLASGVNSFAMGAGAVATDYGSVSIGEGVSTINSLGTSVRSYRHILSGLGGQYTFSCSPELAIRSINASAINPDNRLVLLPGTYSSITVILTGSDIQTTYGACNVYLYCPFSSISIIDPSQNKTVEYLSYTFDISDMVVNNNTVTYKFSPAIVVPEGHVGYPTINLSKNYISASLSHTTTKNISSNPYALALGYNNEVYGNQTIVTGYGNVAQSNQSAVFGSGNYTYSGGDLLIGGSGNVATSSWQMLVAGASHHVYNCGEGTVLGLNNTATSMYEGFVSGAANVNVGSNYSGMFGSNNAAFDSMAPGMFGQVNYMQYANSSVVLGTNNLDISAGSTLLAGQNNYTYGGYSNVISGSGNLVFSGGSNTITGASNLIYGSYQSLIAGSSNLTSSNSLVVSGNNNIVRGYEAMVTGVYNLVDSNYASATGYGGYAGNLGASTHGRFQAATGDGAHAEGTFASIMHDGVYSRGDTDANLPAVRISISRTPAGTYNTLTITSSNDCYIEPNTYVWLYSGTEATDTYHDPYQDFKREYVSAYTRNKTRIYLKAYQPTSISISSITFSKEFYGITYGLHIENNSVINIASGDGSHAEGYGGLASGLGAHTEGGYNIATGTTSHAEGGGILCEEEHTDIPYEVLGFPVHFYPKEGYGSGFSRYWTPDDAGLFHPLPEFGDAAYSWSISTCHIRLGPLDVHGHLDHVEFDTRPSIVFKMGTSSDPAEFTKTARFTMASYESYPPVLYPGATYTMNGSLIATLNADTYLCKSTPPYETIKGLVYYGIGNQADGDGSHAEGVDTRTIGIGSHAEGLGSIAKADYQHVSGTYNYVEEDKLVIVGNGHINDNYTGDATRSNAYTLDQDGNAWFAGDIYVGSTSGTHQDEGSISIRDLSSASLSDSPDGGVTVTVRDTSRNLQRHLIAGDNIEISDDNVISARGRNYRYEVIEVVREGFEFYIEYDDIAIGRPRTTEVSPLSAENIGRDFEFEIKCKGHANSDTSCLLGVDTADWGTRGNPSIGIVGEGYASSVFLQVCDEDGRKRWTDAGVFGEGNIEAGIVINIKKIGNQITISSKNFDSAVFQRIQTRQVNFKATSNGQLTIGAGTVLSKGYELHVDYAWFKYLS